MGVTYSARTASEGLRIESKDEFGLVQTILGLNIIAERKASARPGVV
jgi:hypothetical protein